MKILLAEDDTSISAIARLTLQKVGGHEVVCAENGLEALAKARLEKFDVIILDGMMPDLDGFETCKQLKEDSKLKDVPVIFMTAKNQESDIQDGFKLGAIGYIVKPFDAKELCNEIQKIFNKHLWSKAV